MWTSAALWRRRYLAMHQKCVSPPLSTAQRFAAIQSGEVDVLSRNITASLTRDVSLGLNFAPPNFYTGTGFMVRANSGVKKVEDLDGATVCITPGSSTEQNVAQIFSSRNLHYTPVVIENNKEYVAAYLAGRCDDRPRQSGVAGHQNL